MERTISYNSKRKGFTLAEVMIVVAIVAILAGVSVPLFSAALKSYQLKQVNDLETAAKAAAVSAFYSGYDSKGNEVRISDTGVCTFLYDAENSAVYVLNSSADAQDFANNGYAKSIESYGISDYSGQVILITFDGRYAKFDSNKEVKESIKNDPKNKINLSKGTFEEPWLVINWVPAGTNLLVGGQSNGS